MFTLIDYHFFVLLSRGILFFLKIFLLFLQLFYAFTPKKIKIHTNLFKKQKNDKRKGIPFTLIAFLCSDFLTS
jgi:p-aminobenzoyl-glutamate transporter AbgT